jgi:hypothetical protein
MIIFFVLATITSAIREPAPSANLRPNDAISIDTVLDGTKNLTAVMVNATPISNNTIQITFEANVTSQANTTTTTTAPTTSAPTTTTSAPPTTPAAPTKRTQFSIVYSAHDPMSMHLIRNGLNTMFTRPDINNKTDLELVPYGNVTEIKVNSLSAGFLYWHPELQKGNITNVYRCPHGEAECESSLIHACAVSVTAGDPTAYMPFIACMATAPVNTSPEDSSFECSNSTQFMESLRDCALGSTGIVLQHHLAQQAASTKTPVPSIYINGEYHPFNVSTALSGKKVQADFNKFVCDAIFADGLMDRDVCENGNVTKPVTAPFESLLTPVNVVAKGQKPK